MTTTSTKFKVQGVGLDTSNMTIKPWVDPEDEYSFDYFIHLSQLIMIF